MNASVKMTILVPKEWHKKLKIEAAMRDMTITDIVKTAIDNWLRQNPINEVQEQNTR